MTGHGGRTPKIGLAHDIDQFYKRAQADAVKMGSSQFYNQMLTEQGWEKSAKALLQPLAVHRADAHPAGPRPGFRPDPAATPCPLHPVSQRPGQEPA